VTIPFTQRTRHQRYVSKAGRLQQNRHLIRRRVNVTCFRASLYALLGLDSHLVRGFELHPPLLWQLVVNNCAGSDEEPHACTRDECSHTRSPVISRMKTMMIAHHTSLHSCTFTMDEFHKMQPVAAKAPCQLPSIHPHSSSPISVRRQDSVNYTKGSLRRRSYHRHHGFIPCNIGEGP
jgi:hypothetical protein